MREFKFRAWNKKREVIAFVSAMFLDKLEYHAAVELNYLFNRKIEKTRETVNLSEVELMQFTGLKDCNGREIYENDILKLPSGKITAVSFMFGSFCYDEDFTTNLCNINANSEIIGNTYENADLLDK